MRKVIEPASQWSLNHQSAMQATTLGDQTNGPLCCYMETTVAAAAARLLGESSVVASITKGGKRNTVKRH